MLAKALFTLMEFSTEVRERCWLAWVLEQVEEILENQRDFIRGRRCREGCVVWKEFNCVRDADGFCCRDVTSIVTVMLVGRANIEPFGTVGSPGWSIVCLVVNNCFAACWGQGGVTEIEIAVDLYIVRDGRIDMERPHQIQCDDSLWDKKVPTI